jgi:hypothetical protein
VDSLEPIMRRRGTLEAEAVLSRPMGARFRLSIVDSVVVPLTLK